MNAQNMTDSDFRLHVMQEIDNIKETQAAQGENLAELLAILRASRFGAALIRYLGGLVIAGGAFISILAYVKPK